MWRLGAALAADGKDAEALNAYIESYKTDKPDFGKYAVVEALYRKLNGTVDGLEAKIGPERVAILQTSPEIAPAPTPSATPVAVTQIEASVTSPAVEPTAGRVETKPEPVETKPEPVEVKPEPVETKPEPADTKPEPEPVESKPQPTESKPELTESKPEPTVKKETPPRTEPASPERQEPAETGIEKPKTIPDVSTPAIKPELESPEPAKQTPPETEPTEVRSKPAKAIEEPARETGKPASSAATKPLFEPIIITIPSRRPTKPAASETTKTSTDEKKTAAGEIPVETNREPDRTAVSTGSARPRLIEGREVKVEEPEPCVVDVSQENVSLINGGGKVGILVHVDRPGDIKSLVASSSSPKDIEVILEPEIGGVPDGRFYVIRSISSAVGVYQVTFSTPCGKKELIVTVR